MATAPTALSAAAQAAHGRFCCASAINNTAQPSSSSVSATGAGNARRFQSSHLGIQRVIIPQLNLYLSAPSSSPLPARLLIPRCSSAPEDTPSSSSTSSPPPPPAAPPSPPVVSSQAVEEIGEIRKELEAPRASAPRREADSTDWVSSSLSRRFGLAGGLAWVGFLAFGVISEQIKTRTEVFQESQATQDVEGAKEVVLDNSVKYVELRKGGGSYPLKGDLVLVDVTGRVPSTGEVFVDTSASKRPLAFVFGLKPYPRAVCYGLEYALQSMQAGGKRRVTVPADLCFGDTGEDLGNGVVVPGGEQIEYEVQLQKVSIAPS